jgi:hypothetical protein
VAEWQRNNSIVSFLRLWEVLFLFLTIIISQNSFQFQSTFPITIQLPSKNEVSLRVKRNDTIATIKQYIFDQHDIPINLQQVLHDGVVVNDNMKMESIGVADGSNLVVVSLLLFDFDFYFSKMINIFNLRSLMNLKRR